MSVDPKVLLALLPKNIQEAATGKHSEEYVLFMDLWGTSAALEKYQQTKDLLDRAEVAHMQSHFVSTLGRLSQQFPKVRTTQASDCSFSFSENLEDLISFAGSTFKCMTHMGERFFLLPIRGGIGKGLVRIQDGGTLQSISNFTYTSEIGIGMVESATLEKKGPKGMRLFTTADLAKEIPVRFQNSHRATKDKDGKDIIELNWTHPDSHNTSYLTESIKGQTSAQFLDTIGKNWIFYGDKYQKEVGQSLVDLLSW